MSSSASDSSSSSFPPIRALAPLLSGASLFIGTGTTLWIAANARRKKLQLRAKNNNKNDNNGQLESTSIDKNDSDNNDLPVISSTINKREKDNGDGDGGPLLFPTVSASTNIVGSLTYNIFVVTALIHGSTLILTSIFQRDLLSMSLEDNDDNHNDNDNNDDNESNSPLGMLLIIGGSITGVALILASILPAKGKTTCIHVILGIVFKQMAIVWMVWTCIYTKNIGMTVSMFGIRIALSSLAIISLTWSAYCMHQTSKLRGAENGNDDQWYGWMHKTALGQMSFGLFFTMYLLSLTVDMVRGI